MARDLPSGTVTFLFTDIEGSTRLLRELGSEGYAAVQAEHRRIIREAFTAHGGVEVDTQGDAFFIAFPTANGALAAAAAAQSGLADGPIRVRMGIHTGTPLLTAEGGYVGPDVNRAARIAGAGHGGQVLVSSATSALFAGDDLEDLGEHRLKDIVGAVSIFQLGSERFPPLKTISNTNLPRPASSFVGREREVAEVAALLGNGTRLLTLTGPGGSGKTRLAVEAAATLVPAFRAGVFWVGLSALRDPTLVPATIAQTLGATGDLAAHIAEREMLLVLDNLEQVVGAAPALGDLGEACPNLKIVTTSRELLRIRGEVEYAVAPLATPEAVELFCARAGVEPDTTVAELCRRLDNLPLAVELAAARSGVLSPQQILDRLAQRLDVLKGGRDADPRQLTLRATIAWSHDLLTSDERRLFARLAVFRGGCTLDAAETVADADLDVLQSLVDKSLVRHVEDRFLMLETIREFASERLEASDEADALRIRHAEYFLAVANELDPFVPLSRAWLDRVEAEHDNVRAAIDRLHAAGEVQFALRLADAVWRFWARRGHQEEAERRFGLLLAADPAPTLARARALNAAAGMAVDLGDPATSRRRAAEALDLHRELGDASGIARSTFMLGYAAIESGDFATAEPYFEDALERFRELGLEHQVLLATFNLAWAVEELGDMLRARALIEDNLSRARASGNRTIEGSSLDTLGGFARDDGRTDEAFTMLTDGLRIHLDLGDPTATLDSLGRIARTHAVVGDLEKAAILLASSEALHEQLGLPVAFYQQQRNRAIHELIGAGLDASAAETASARGRELTLDEAVELALSAAAGRIPG